MLNLGLNHADFLAYLDGLAHDHRVRITGELLTLDHAVVGRLDGRVVGGQVDWTLDTGSGGDANTAPERTASVQFTDPGDTLNLGTDGGPRAGMFYADRMVRLSYGVKSAQFPQWVDAPLITGPITKATRATEGTVTLEVADKSNLLFGVPASLKTYPKGSRITDVVVDMARRCGERFMDVQPSAVRLTKPFAEVAGRSVWQNMHSVAGGLTGWRVAYDARGYLVLKPKVTAPVFTFRGGTGGMLHERPTLTFDASNIKNMVVVTGGTPEGAKGVASATVYAPATSPFNGDALGRGGVPRWLRLDVQDDSITSSAAALARANAELSSALNQAATLELSSLPLPCLEPGDPITVDAGEWSWAYGPTAATIPLDGSGTMTIGRTYAVRNAFRPRSMPKPGRARRPSSTSPAKIPPAKKAAKPAAAKGKTTHASTPAHKTSKPGKR